MDEMKKRGKEEKWFIAISLIIISILAFLILFNSLKILNEIIPLEIRFKKELDSFFGEGNWKKNSTDDEGNNFLGREYVSDAIIDYYESFKSRLPMYRVWVIDYNINSEDEMDQWIFHDKTKRRYNERVKGSLRRFSTKDDFILNLTEFGLDYTTKFIYDDILSEYLNEEQMDTLRVNLKSINLLNRKTRKELIKKTWFNINDISVKKYLESNGYQVELDILAFEYKFDKLSDEDKENMLNSLPLIEQRIKEIYGESLYYDIYFDKEHRVKNFRFSWSR